MPTQADDAVVPEKPPATTSSSASDTHERKRKQLFDSLSTAELGLKGTILEQSTSTEHRLSVDRRPTRQPDDDDMVAIRERRVRGEESIFKKPPPGIMKCLKPRKTPDYQVNNLNGIIQMYLTNLVTFISQVNPHKWKKYSLSDADTSDRTNTAAAFEFLKQIEERKRDEAADDDDVGSSGMDVDSSDSGKIVFKQRRRLPATGSASVAKFNQSVHLRAIVESGSAEENADKPVLRGSKVLMPEYVIGQKVAKEKKSRTLGAGGSSKNQLKLGHLFDEEEGDDD